MTDSVLKGEHRKHGYDGKIAGLYDLEKTIGQGHFAVVKLARHVFTGEKVAVKVIDKTKLDEVSRAHLFQEVRCMKLVQHPHVVRLYEVIDTQTKLYLILELGDGGDMYDYIMKKKGLEEDIARTYFKQIVEAISYCHRLHVVHRDLKPENVVFFEKQGLVKVTDFGFSNMFKPGKKLDTSCGSLAYSAPEILLGDAYDAPAVDIWSLGVILYMLVCGEPPFQEANDSETLTMIMDCKYNLPPHISSDCKNLISRMLIRNPSERLTLDEIIADLWLHMADSPTMNPLVSMHDLSEDERNHIIQRMVEGKIATREDILQSLAKDSYDHITSTYYLLAERRLKKQYSKAGSIDAGLTTHPAASRLVEKQNNGKPNLESLALSPRIQPKQCHDSASNMFIETLLSPGSSKSCQPMSESGDCSPSRRKPYLHKCMFIHQESIDEEDDSMDIEVDDSKLVARSETSVDPQCQVHFCSDGGDTVQKRTLTGIASSPLLLNQINEEGESDEGEHSIPAKMNSQLMVVRTHTSPDMAAKYERRRRRGAGQRGTSCSSSDASDTDDTESRSRKEKLKHKIVHRRDSGDQSSDTDGQNGPGTGGGGGGGTRFNSSNTSFKTTGDNSQSGNRKSSDSDNNNNNNNGDGRQRKNNIHRSWSISEVYTARHLAELLATSAHQPKQTNGTPSLTSMLSSLSLSSSLPRRNGSKYIYDDYYDKKLSPLSYVTDVLSREFFNLSNLISPTKLDNVTSSTSPVCNKYDRDSTFTTLDKRKTDIHSNGLLPGVYTTEELNVNSTLPPLKYDGNCCSIV